MENEKKPALSREPSEEGFSMAAHERQIGLEEQLREEQEDVANPHERFDEALKDLEQSEHIEPPPNGGFWAWMQVLGGFFCNFCAWGIVNSFGVFQEYYSKELLSDCSPGQISWIGALCGFCAFSGAIIFGPLVDLAYHTRIVLVAGTMQALALMMLSLCTKYYQVLLSHGIFVGLSASALFLVSLSTVAPWFTTKRAVAMGLSSCGSAFGGTMFSSIARKLLVQVGFPWTTRILGFIIVFNTGIMVATVRARLPPRKRGGLLALECFKEPMMMCYCLSTIASFCGLYTFYFYFQSYAVHEQPGVTALVYSSALLNAGSVVGRVLPNFLAPKIGVFNCLIFTYLFSGIVAFCWIPAHSTGALMALAVIFGAVSGAVMGLPGTVVASLTPDMNRMGVRLSFTFLFNGIGLLVGAPMAGILIRNYGYFWAKLYSGLTWLLAFAITLAIRMVYCRGKIFKAF